MLYFERNNKARSVKINSAKHHHCDFCRLLRSSHEVARMMRLSFWT